MSVKLRTVLTLLCLFVLNIALAEYPLEKPSIESGKEIFISNCASCHGEKGDGSGMNSAYDFTDHEKMINENSTAFFKSVTNGRQGTAMPAFGNLSEAKRWGVIAHIWTFWADMQSAESGKEIFDKNCASCHGLKGDGSGLQGAFDFNDLERMVNEKPEDFFKSVSNGRPNTSMPPWKNVLSESEEWGAVKYVWTFQFKDYPLALQPVQVLAPAPEATPAEEWYKTAVGATIAIISLGIAAGIIYLFAKGVLER